MELEDNEIRGPVPGFFCICSFIPSGFLPYERGVLKKNHEQKGDVIESVTNPKLLLGKEREMILLWLI